MRAGEKTFLAESTAPERVEFDELEDGDEALVVIELDKETLIPNWGNLVDDISVDNISIRLRSEIIGQVPSPDRLALAFYHAHAYFLFNEQVYAGILECPAVSVCRPELCEPGISEVFLGSVLPNLPNQCKHLPLIPNDNSFPIPIYAAAKKRYRPVHRRTVPVPTTLPEKFRVIRQFPSDPLKHLPMLNPNPPPFTPTGRYTQERKEIIDNAHDQSFL
ncbi:hypothetical protein BT96DRAFT_830824, partial [Gymnopus androsaceus JB14]